MLRIRNDLFRIRIQPWIIRVLEPDLGQGSGSMRIRIQPSVSVFFFLLMLMTVMTVMTVNVKVQNRIFSCGSGSGWPFLMWIRIRNTVVMLPGLLWSAPALGFFDISKPSSTKLKKEWQPWIESVTKWCCISQHYTYRLCQYRGTSTYVFNFIHIILNYLWGSFINNVFCSFSPPCGAEVV